nr:hypothetical protein [Escherichia coli]
MEQTDDTVSRTAFAEMLLGRMLQSDEAALLIQRPSFKTPAYAFRGIIYKMLRRPLVVRITSLIP